MAAGPGRGDPHGDRLPRPGRAREIASVWDAWIRPRIVPLLPQPLGRGSSRVPDLPDLDRDAYLAEIAAMMDDRKDARPARRPDRARRGRSIPWPGARRSGRPPTVGTKASSIGAYRETYGYDHPEDPIGPEPIGDAPDQRAAWHEGGRRPRTRGRT